MKPPLPRRMQVGWNVSMAGAFAFLALCVSLETGCKQSAEPTASPREADAKTSGTERSAPAKEESSTDKASMTKGTEELARPEPAAVAPKKSGKEVLDSMVAAYKKAPSYADKGTLRLRATQGGQKDEKSYDYSLVFVRPNKIRLQVYEGVMVCDGRELMAFANDLPDQVAKRPAPPTIDIKTVFSDRILGSAISQGPTQGFSWAPIALLLMAAEDPLKTILDGKPEIVLLESAKIGEHDCYRVKIDRRRDGAAVLWIDQRSFVLRRMEFPTEVLAKAFGEQKVDEISMAAEFQEAGLGDQVDDAIFRHEIPAKAQVGEWLLPPPLLMLGKSAPEFSFVGMDQKPIDSKSIAGKVAVLDFWATWCGPCRVSLPITERLYKKFKDNPKVLFLAVSVDAAKTENKEVKGVLDELNVTIPFARDPEQHAGKRFGVQGIPSLCIIGPSNTVQAYETGYRPGLDDELTKRIESLLAGQDVYREQISQFDAQRKEYAAWLDKWAEKGVYIAPGGEEMEVPEAKIGARTEPKAFTLEPLWKCAELKMPGNMVAVPGASGPPKLFVLDSWSSVADIGANGKVAVARPLELPERQAATMIRTAAGADGKRYYLISGVLQQQAHLFDENWKKILSYPKDVQKNPHAGIMDVQLADLDGDGKLEILVGYYQDVGVHCVNFEGERIWFDRSVAMVSRMAVWAAEPKGPRVLLCTNSLGSLAIIDAKGKRQGEIKVPSRPLHWVVAADLLGDQKMLLAGLYPPELGTSVAIGIDPNGAELWNCPLPKGGHLKPVEQIVAGSLAPTGPAHWIIPGPDGSIAVVGADGKLVDRWQTGAVVAGLTTMNVDGQPVLVVASANAVEAWRVKWPASPK